ncbi:hypothetical protein HPCPY1313_1221 [Helicobacter pylori CPY1313]|nr:hypothetical protein HPCPY1313_1221 [Helicobacter pylori CPY1313]
MDEAMKKFDDLKEMELPKDYQTIKDKLESLFSFDMDKEAGQVSEEIKEHMSKVGREFIEKGIELQKKMPDNACPFCTQEITNKVILAIILSVCIHCLPFSSIMLAWSLCIHSIYSYVYRFLLP